MHHIPVLPEETVTLLAPERGGIFVDGTLGFGGHASLVLERARLAGKTIALIGIDQDTDALNHAKEKLGDAIQYVQGNFSDLKKILKSLNIGGVDGILLDIGVSSYQIDNPERGFSFLHDGPLDMRMNKQASLTAAELINDYSEKELADIIFRYGEERLSRRIAAAIVARRGEKPFSGTKELAEFIVPLYPAHQRFKHPHPATRTFQALRIAVNRELEVLEQGINAALEMLNPNGRLVVISFHSLEDRIVKYMFRHAALDGGFEIITKRPIVAREEELKANGRSRSAKVRVIAKLP